jgi:opacity protein-like surface antigen
MKSMIKTRLIIGLMFASTQLMAENSPTLLSKDAHPWSITSSLGLANYQYMEGDQGQTAIGRLAFGNHMLSIGNTAIGVEIGLQSGNQMRFDIPKKTIDSLGGVPITGTIQPTLDVLLTFKTPLSTSLPLYALVKAGANYRQLRMDRTEINDRSEISPEIQAGLGFSVNENLMVSLVYQRILGGNPNFTANALTETGVIARIPRQEAVFFGLTFIL